MLDHVLVHDPNVDHSHLQGILADCQDCGRRCRKLQKQFEELANDENATISNAGQLAKWIWHDKRIDKLRREIDGQMSSISLNLQISDM